MDTFINSVVVIDSCIYIKVRIIHMCKLKMCTLHRYSLMLGGRQGDCHDSKGTHWTRAAYLTGRNVHSLGKGVGKNQNSGHLELV